MKSNNQIILNYVNTIFWTIPIQKPLFIRWTLSSNSSNDLTVNTLSGEDAIFSSSDLSILSPIPKANTLAFFSCSREERTSRGVYDPWVVVCLPSVITRTGYKGQERKQREMNKWITSKEINKNIQINKTNIIISVQGIFAVEEQS